MGALRRELPPPPAGRSGWPWTDTRAPELPIPAERLPRITIVTPSYNQGRYLEETIRSVLAQGYPNLEYIVIDGDSEDDSREIIRRYEPWLAHWVSEPDDGQAAAINKGFARSTGEVHGYLNSDDVYRPGALIRVARGFRPEPRGLHAFPVMDVDEQGRAEVRSVPLRRRGGASRSAAPTRPAPPPDGARWGEGIVPLVTGELFLHQPGVFWPAAAQARAGGFDERYDYMFDQRFFLELMLQGLPLICHGGDPVVRFRYHDLSKTVTAKGEGANPFSLELWRIAREIEPRLERGEREAVHGTRTRRTLSGVWRDLRSGAGRGTALRRLLRSVADHPDLIAERFFWSTVAGLGRRRPPR